MNVSTEMGKTAMAVLAGCGEDGFIPDESIRKATPRRLVYCLPMRALVEQTVKNAQTWLKSLDLLGESGEGKVFVHVLMRGEEQKDWDVNPGYDQIIIGTQDMLLSRALNQVYAVTRSCWPMQCGLLNTDCLATPQKGTAL